MRYLVLIAIVAAALALWVRIAPSSPGKWHIALDPAQDPSALCGLNSICTVIDGGKEAFERLYIAAQTTEKTQVLAGSAREGHVTLVTRSALMAYPDYATLHLHPASGKIVIFSRSRFGLRDFGVNKARVDGWLSSAGLS